MGLSIYYTATRKQRLSSIERLAIDAAIARFSVDDQIEEYLKTGNGLIRVGFGVYDPEEPTKADVVFEGATKMPSNTEDALWVGIQHWCKLLTEIRLQVLGASWQVNVDDHDIVWDSRSNSYDPSQ